MKKQALLFITFLYFPTFILQASSAKFLIAALHGNVNGLKKELTKDRRVLIAIDHQGKNAFDLAVEARTYRIGIEQGESYCQNSKPLTDFFMEWFTFNRANLTPNEKANNKKLREQECLFTIFNTYRETIQFLLEQHSFNIDKHTQYGMTALHTAALSNDQSLVALLLKNGASPFAKSKPWPPREVPTFLMSAHNGNTALHFAATVDTSLTHHSQLEKNVHVLQQPFNTPSLEEIQKMKISGNSPSTQNRYHSIHQAINTQNQDGYTPLMLAIIAVKQIKNRHVLESNAIILLKNPAVNLTIKNNLGKTALDLAKENELSWIIYLIEELITSRKKEGPLKPMPLPKPKYRPRTTKEEEELKKYLVFSKKKPQP